MGGQGGHALHLLSCTKSSGVSSGVGSVIFAMSLLTIISISSSSKDDVLMLYLSGQLGALCPVFQHL